MKSFTTKYLKSDVQSGVVVFLVAIPLCLGIALASGAPLFSGIIAGIVGGIVVGTLSNSQLSVSGPAAGLSAIVLSAIASLGSFEMFLMAGVLAGLIQLALGFMKAGIVSNYLPSNVIEGMLAAIGIIIIISQLPHAVGYDVANSEVFITLMADTGNGAMDTLYQTLNNFHFGAILIMLASLAVLILFQKNSYLKSLKVVPGALVAVLLGILMNEAFRATGSSLFIGENHLVTLPVFDSFSAFLTQSSFPDFNGIARAEVWIVAFTIAAVASVETLLCIEAADKMDPLKRYTDTNIELKAQGFGNMISSAIGGLPMTSVIVRTSANVNSGGKTKLAAISHGVFLLIAVISIPHLLNKIPLASLAAILFSIGFKLASPAVFSKMWKNGKSRQFLPFIITIIAIVFTDLLIGVAIGLAVSIFNILRGNLKLAYYFKKEDHVEGETIHMELAQEVSFLNKAAIKHTLAHIPEKSKLVIDASNTVYIDHDVLTLLKDFRDIGSKEKEIDVEYIGFRKEYKLENSRSHVTAIMEPDEPPVSPKRVARGIKVPSNILVVKELNTVD